MTKTKESASSRRGAQPAAKSAATRARYHKGVISELPEPTQRELQRLRALSKRPDSEIDLSDIPEITDEQWRTAVRYNPYLAKKKQITVRLDTDILDWLQSFVKGYQTRLNVMLRMAMKADQSK